MGIFLGRCDDSNGNIGDIFRYTAKKLFVYFASRCEYKLKIGEMVFVLNAEDEYGVRDTFN